MYNSFVFLEAENHMILSRCVSVFINKKSRVRPNFRVGRVTPIQQLIVCALRCVF